jgi:hypothetical protein
MIFSREGEHHAPAAFLLANFRALREANPALLKSVPRKFWENYGVHAERGNESVNHIVKMVARTRSKSSEPDPIRYCREAGKKR